MKKTIATVFAALVALAAAAQWHYLPADAGRYTLLHTQNIDTLHKSGLTLPLELFLSTNVIYQEYTGEP